MRTYRAAPSAYGAFGAITGALGFLWLMVVWRTGATWTPLAVPLLGFVAVALWLSRYRIVMDQERVTLTLPFRPVTELERSEVLSVEFAGETGLMESPATLSIRTSYGEELRLNAKVFSHEAVEALLSFGTKRAA
jgi:hypothetical protein